jgi:hypothetical protein
MDCFRYISVNALHKGADDDDDDEHKVKALQKTVILSRAHILRKLVM